MYGVTGATGQLGRLVISTLKDRGFGDETIALVRDPAKGADLGVKTRAFDYDSPATLAEALAGVDKLLLISASEVGKRKAQHENVIAAAKQAGVKEIVYTSLLHADTSPIGLAEEHRQTEALLKASGIPHTILRNGWYTENYTGSIGGALAGGAFIGSAGDGRISAAPRQDFAEAAASVLTGTGHTGQVYELAGDESFTLTDLAAEISRQSGKTIPYANLPVDEYAKTLTGFGLPEGLAQAIAGWDADAASDALFDDSKALSRLIGRPTTPLATLVADSLKA